MGSLPADTAGFFAELRRRRVIRAVLAYGAGVFALVQVADPVFAGLLLPDLAFRILVLVSIAGFPVVAALAWIYQLTREGLRLDRAGGPDDRARIPVSRYLQVIGAFTVAAAVVAVTAGAVARARYPASDDGRVGLAIFPFRVVGDARPEWSEGAADLLATALEGTPSLRVVDPWPLWRPLREGPVAPALPPDVAQAESLTHEAGAHRFLLGSVVRTGDQVEVSLRLYQIGRVEPIDVFSVNAGMDSLSAVTRQAALRVLTRVWGALRPRDLPTELDFDATQSAEAMQAYLAAKEAMRRGLIDSADASIDRAISLDSTFVLALVEAVTIKSWGQSIQGQPYQGFFEILDLAEAHAGRVNERTRLRLAGARASVRTDGRAAMDAARRILELDPMDYGANASLDYYLRAYGWQVAPPSGDDRPRTERLVALDSTQIPALSARAWWAVVLEDTTDQRVQLERLRRADTTGILAKREIMGLRAVLATDGEFARLMPQLLEATLAEVSGVARNLRVADVRRYDQFLQGLDAPGSPFGALADIERLRLLVAQGRLPEVEAAIESGEYALNDYFRTAQRYLLAADLADVGDGVLAGRAAADLSLYVPPDSALAYFGTRPAWWTGWILGAWHAQRGDTARARRWVEVIGTFPRGGTSEDYVGSLQADIEARLAARRRDEGAALDQARTAFRLWSIHTDNQHEGLPDPAMRLHLALRYKDAHMADSARAMMFSLVPPTTWMGFLTARASYELGLLEEERGDGAAAARHYSRALALWRDGGPAVTEWAARAQEGFRRASGIELPGGP